MLSKVWSIFSSSKSSPADTLTGIELEGIIYLKRIGQEKILLSNECIATLSIVNDKTFDYNLYIVNEDSETETGEF